MVWAEGEGGVLRAVAEGRKVGQDGAQLTSSRVTRYAGRVLGHRQVQCRDLNGHETTGPVLHPAGGGGGVHVQRGSCRAQASPVANRLRRMAAQYAL